MERLIDAELYHAYARGFCHWWVRRPSGTIILDSWFALQPGKIATVPSNSTCSTAG